jgi:hypothetical protein
MFCDRFLGAGLDSLPVIGTVYYFVMLLIGHRVGVRFVASTAVVPCPALLCC